MKKTLILTTLMASLAITSPIAMAHHTPEHTAETLQNKLAKDVASAKLRADGAPVQLKGYLIKKTGKERYTFQDRTGTITVEIDDELMGNRKPNAKKAVTLIGEADVELQPDGLRLVKIDVEKIR
ncbi:YgiW/YdeI family stress tolerance OB fold protein [Moraxella sp. ZY210820]|uniref:YgiW/YdeI family stress tolerance OB fold protein n=1 Tax=unclassified Moraxella TaxID=2685852 RepID=UPI002731C76E|nr:NirD/YgiW/YdeI family stress tolerance protein [Moraxella sp. ZY210820]WLF84919.1 NirD/YgiW/YdeI family stress tolerance protein [Moraxella sp. ZY210820]